MLQIIQKRKYAYLFSWILTTASLVLLMSWGLKLGIDFKGGTLMEVQFSRDPVPQVSEVEKSFADLSLQSLTVQATDNRGMLLRYLASDENANDRVLKNLQSFDPSVVQLRTDFIGGSVSDQIKRNALTGIVLSVLCIALYIAWAFRRVSGAVTSWEYGLGAVIALAHDIIVVIAIFAITIFGGDSIRYFGLALLIGVIFGTYSSIYVASALLVTRYKMKTKG